MENYKNVHKECVYLVQSTSWTQGSLPPLNVFLKNYCLLWEILLETKDNGDNIIMVDYLSESSVSSEIVISSLNEN